MTRLKKSVSVRQSQHADDTPGAVMSSTADPVTTSIGNVSQPTSVHVATTIPDTEQQDIYAALADTSTDHQTHDISQPSTLSNEDDSETESAYSVEEHTHQVIGRASSVKVGKPTIIEHKPTKQGRLQVKNMDSIQESNDGDVIVSSPVSRRPSAISQVATTVFADNAPAPQVHASLQQSFADTVPPALPTGSTLHSIHPTIINNETIEELRHASEPEQGISRAMSSPLPKPSRGLSRRVTIRPSDLVIRNHDRDGPNDSNFRESVVTNPYPGRRPSFGEQSLDPQPRNDSDSASNIGNSTQLVTDANAKEKQTVSFLKSPGSKDRFLSPTRPETLFLDIDLARHPNMRTTIEVQIADRSKFDDEMLFDQIRAAYYKELLGTVRYTLLSVRRLGNVLVTKPAGLDSSDFNSVDFLKHFHNPNIGKKRKAWVIWLRNNNSRRTTRLSTLSTATMYPGPVRRVDTFSRRSLRTRNDRQSQQLENSQASEKKHERKSSDSSSFHFAYSPGIPRLPFTQAKARPVSESASPTQLNGSSPVRSFFWPSNLSASLSTASRMACNADEDDKEKNVIITLSLQHVYRPVVISLLLLLVTILAAAVGIMWVVFGVPGTRPGDDGMYLPTDNLDYKFGDEIEKTAWRADAGHRVVTGVVISIAVFILGCVIEGALLWMSWLLL